jgi:hypothetical protein
MFTGKLIEHVVPLGYELAGSELFLNRTLAWAPHACICMRVTMKGGVEISRDVTDAFGTALESVDGLVLGYLSGGALIPLLAPLGGGPVPQPG